AIVGGPDQSRRHRNERRDERQPVDPDERGELHHLVVGGEGVAQQIERKAREYVTAQPFGGRQEARERYDAGGAARPEEVRDRGGGAPEQGKDRGKAEDRERHQGEIDSA